MKGLPTELRTLIMAEIDSELAKTPPHQKLKVDIQYQEGKIKLQFTRTNREEDA